MMLPLLFLLATHALLGKHGSADYLAVVVAKGVPSGTVSISPGGRYIVHSENESGLFRCWDVNGNTQTSFKAAPYSRMPIFSNDGGLLVSWGFDLPNSLFPTIRRTVTIKSADGRPGNIVDSNLFYAKSSNVVAATDLASGKVRTCRMSGSFRVQEVVGLNRDTALAFDERHRKVARVKLSTKQVTLLGSKHVYSIMPAHSGRAIARTSLHAGPQQDPLVDDIVQFDSFAQNATSIGHIQGCDRLVSLIGECLVYIRSIRGPLQLVIENLRSRESRILLESSKSQIYASGDPKTGAIAAWAEDTIYLFRPGHK